MTSGDLDEVILLIYRAPNSYTKEDVVEFQGHGGRACAKRILRAVLDSGARPAEPGEFTKRAFLNGRIDLLQAEAVADLIMARSDRAASAAVEQLEGNLSSSFSGIYECMINVVQVATRRRSSYSARCSPRQSSFPSHIRLRWKLRATGRAVVCLPCDCVRHSSGATAEAP